MTKAALTTQDILEISQQLRCEPAALRAVIEVETAGRGFIADGRPVVLFERHWFHRLTNGRFSSVAPALSSTTPGGYARGRTAEVRAIFEWDRLSAASRLDWEAAMMSASWGLPQILGVNYASAGCATLGEFVERMHESEREHLEMMAAFLRVHGLEDELQHRDWAGFARVYNGPNYRKNGYDTKLAAAYARNRRG